MFVHLINVLRHLWITLQDFFLDVPLLGSEIRYSIQTRVQHDYLMSSWFRFMSGIIMFSPTCNKMIYDIVVPTKPIFYRRFVDDIYNRRKKTQDKFYHSLNNYHKNIKLTVEVSANKFLDTHLFNQNGTYITQVHKKETKTPTHCWSCIPKRYKRNSITTDLHRAQRIATDVIKHFNQDQLHNEITEQDEPLTPPDFFEIEKPFHLLYLPYCEKNEVKSLDFIKRFHEFLELQLVGKQEKLVLCFHWKIKICTHLAKFIMVNVNNVEKIIWWNEKKLM